MGATERVLAQLVAVVLAVPRGIASEVAPGTLAPVREVLALEVLAPAGSVEVTRAVVLGQRKAARVVWGKAAARALRLEAAAVKQATGGAVLEVPEADPSQSRTCWR